MLSSRLILSDVDGTLIDFVDTPPPGWDQILSALEPGDLFALASSRTTSELLAIQSSLGLAGPLLSENGSMVVLGTDWPGVLAGHVERIGGRSHRVLALGSRRSTLMAMMRAVASECNLPLTQTDDPWHVATNHVGPYRLVLLDDAAIRSRSLVMQVVSTRRQRDQLDMALSSRGLTMASGGRWRVIQSGSNKGIAASVLRNMLHAHRYRPQVIAVGNHENDRPMLELADVRIVVRLADGSVHPALANLAGVFVPDAPGPAAWVEIAAWLSAREVHHA